MKKTEKIPVVNPYACGIDVGSKAHYVPIGQGIEDVRSFGSWILDFVIENWKLNPILPRFPFFQINSRHEFQYLHL
jgi:hypothetical protein